MTIQTLGCGLRPDQVEIHGRSPHTTVCAMMCELSVGYLVQHGDCACLEEGIKLDVRPDDRKCPVRAWLTPEKMPQIGTIADIGEVWYHHGPDPACVMVRSPHGETFTEGRGRKKAK